MKKEVNEGVKIKIKMMKKVNIVDRLRVFISKGTDPVNKLFDINLWKKIEKMRRK